MQNFRILIVQVKSHQICTLVGSKYKISAKKVQVLLKVILQCGFPSCTLQFGQEGNINIPRQSIESRAYFRAYFRAYYRAIYFENCQDVPYSHQ